MNLFKALSNCVRYYGAAVKEVADAKALADGLTEALSRATAETEKKRQENAALGGQLERAVSSAQQDTDLATTQLEQLRGEIAEKEAKRNKDFETEPLIMLRAVDATPEGFSADLATTAQHSLDLIESVTGTIAVLARRSAQDAKHVAVISQRLGANQGILGTLKGAIIQVELETEKQVMAHRDAIGELGKRIVATPETDVKRAILLGDQLGKGQVNQAAERYLTSIKDTRATFDLLGAGSAAAGQSANQLEALVTQHRGFANSLSIEAVPATIAALEQALVQHAAEHTINLGAAVREVTERARLASGGAFKRAAGLQAELSDAEAKGLDGVIEALKGAHTQLQDRLKVALTESDRKDKLMEGVVKEASALDGLVKAAAAFSADTAGGRQIASGEPARPADGALPTAAKPAPAPGSTGA